MQKGVPSGVLNAKKPAPIAKAKAARMVKPVRAVVVAVLSQRRDLSMSA